MARRSSSKLSRSSSRGSSQDFLVGILLVTVIIETFLLVRPHLKDQQKKTLTSPKKTVSRVIAREPVARPPEPLIPLPPIPVPSPSPARIEKGRGLIAVIIDDNGYNSSDCERVAAISQPVTLAVLPDLEFSRQIAFCAHREGKEVMLHLPLEPHVNHEKYPEDYVIKTSMDEEQILHKLKLALARVPFVRGVNNHMGSKATEDQRVMSVIIRELKNRKLFFVDSRSTSQSVCPEVAREYRIPFTGRDVFLDNRNTRSAIEAQFAVLAQRAKKTGKAVGIGHARVLTWQVVKEQLEKLSQAGYEIVTVADIINAP